jgi:uncharacterized protein YbbC (DUF1343 family)
VQVVVCDRPNPINGVDVEGAALVARLRVVRRPVPDSDATWHDDRELARLFNAHFRSAPSSRSWRWMGWRREMFADETGLPWVMPSPNMPTLDTAVVYPGTVLFEGTLLSEGRGTTRPFELLARRASSRALRPRDERAGLPGAFIRPPCSSRRSRSTRSSRAAAARCT